MDAADLLEALTQRFSAAEGTEALYRELSVYALVRVKEVYVDGWGVKAKVELMADLASDKAPQTEWEISACWSVFIALPGVWHSTVGSWRLLFNQELSGR
jgi:hypothetical protein